MHDVAKKHQLAIARKTLFMTPTMAKIMGGMDYEEAYYLIFKTDLRARLQSLIEQYGPIPQSWLSWELGMYGWETPKQLLDALD